MTKEGVIRAAKAWLDDVWGSRIADATLDSNPIEIALAGSGGPRLPKPYATVRTITHGLSDGRPVEKQAGDGEITYVNHRRDIIEVQVFTSGPEAEDWDHRAGPMEILDILRDSSSVPTHKRTASDLGIAVLAISDPQDLTEVLATRHESRGMAELTVAYRREFVDASAGSITRIIGTVDIDGIDASVDVSA